MKRLLFLLLFGAVLFPGKGVAQFSDDSEENLCMSFQETYSSAIGTLPDGSFYLVYNAPVGDDIFYYLMFYNSKGEAQWDDFKLVSQKPTKKSFNNNQLIYVDREGNAVVCAPNSQYDPGELSETYSVYKVDKNGNDLWSADGIDVAGSDPKRLLAMVSFVQMVDGSYVFSWTESSPGNDYKYRIRMQRLSEDGQLLWGEGKTIESENETVSDPIMVDAGNNEFILVYSQGTSQHIYADKFDFEGNSLWGEPTLVYGQGGFGSTPLWTNLRAVPAEAGVVVGWHDGRYSTECVYVSYIRKDGTYGFAEGADGLKLNYSGMRAFNPELAYDADNGLVYVIWRETSMLQDQQGILSQLVSLSGELLWNPNDQERALCPVGDYQASYHSARIGAKGTYCAFYMVNYDNDTDVRALAFLQDGDGRPLWENSETVISNHQSDKSDLSVSELVKDQWVCVWTDARAISGENKYDISHVFGQNLGMDGKLGNGSVQNEFLPKGQVEEMAVWPNPAVDMVSIQIKGEHLAGRKAECLLYDLHGSVKDTQLLFMDSESDASLVWHRPSSLASGVYVLKVQVGNEIYATKLILH